MRPLSLFVRQIGMSRDNYGSVNNPLQTKTLWGITEICSLFSS